MFKKLLLTTVLTAAALFAAPCCNMGDANNTKACGKNAKGGMACGAKGSKSCGPVCMEKGPIHCFKMAKLGLSKEQDAKIAEISKSYTTKIAGAQKACGIMPMQFVKDGKFDKEAFTAKHNEATANVAALKAGMFGEAYDVLDDKQKAKLADFSK